MRLVFLLSYPMFFHYRSTCDNVMRKRGGMKRSGVQYHIPEGINGLELLTCSDANYYFLLHFHDSYCIWLNTRSAETYTCKGNSGILQTGEIGIISPGEVHSNRVFESESPSCLLFILTLSSSRKSPPKELERLIH